MREGERKKGEREREKVKELREGWKIAMGKEKR